MFSKKFTLKTRNLSKKIVSFIIGGDFMTLLTKNEMLDINGGGIANTGIPHYVITALHNFIKSFIR